MQKVLSRWLLTALIISLGFGQLLRFEILDIPLYLHDLLVAAIILLNCNVGKCKIPPGIKIFLMGLAIGWLRALTLYPLTSLLIPALYSLRLLAYLALYIIVKKQSHAAASFAFILAGGISLLLGLAQYFFYSDMRVFYYLGWDDHLNRLVMPHFDPTFSAAMLALFFFYTYPQYRFSSFFHFTGILLSYSRSIWLTLILTIFATSKKIMLFLISVLIILVAAYFLPRGFGEGNNLLRTFSITSRLTSDLNYLSTYKWDLLWGRGLNTLILEKSDSILPSHATGPNNSYFYLLLTSGVVGLVGWGVFLKELYRESSHQALIMFIVIGSFFNNLMFYPFTLLFMLLAQNKKSKAPTLA